MSNHDPLADPLSPYWRAKVEAAARIVPAEPGRVFTRYSALAPVLTPVERETLALLSAGHSVSEIVARRGVSRTAVYAARDRARRKLKLGARP